MKRFSSRASTLQRIDRLAGAPVCWALTLARRVAGWFRPEPRPRAAYRSVLFIKLAEQGSTVLAHTAIRAAVARAGREHVYFLAFEENRFILDVLELIPEANVLTVRTRTPWEMAASALHRLREIRALRLDACVDLEFFARLPAALSFLTGARLRAGFHPYFGAGPYRGDLLTHRVLFNPQLHTSQAFLTLVKALETDPARLPAFDYVPPPPAPPPHFVPTPAERDEVRAVLERAGVAPAARLVLLNANASDLLPLRKWEGANYVALARRLLAEFADATVAFTGGPEEAAPVEELVAAVGSPRCVSLAGKTTLRQLLVLYGLAEVLVTNDSGPAHFASLTAVDTVVLFGPETPALFGAPGPRTHALWAGLACSPCINAYNNRQTACRNNCCLQRLTVDEVFATACTIYRQRAKPAA